MKNKAAALIVAGLPKDEEGEESSENTMSDEEVAADDVITAVEENDPAALVDALKAFLEVCGYVKKESKSEEEYED